MTANRQLATAAGTLTRRVADLLGADVMIVDQQGEMLARGSPARSPRPPGDTGTQEAYDYVSVPIQLAGENVEVLVSAPHTGPLTSPKVARSIIQMMSAQRRAIATPGDHDTQVRMLMLQLLHDADGELNLGHRELGLDLALPRVALLVEAAPFILSQRPQSLAAQRAPQAREEQRAHLVTNYLLRFFPHSEDVVVGYVGGGELVALVPVRDSDLTPWGGAGGLKASRNSPQMCGALEKMGGELQKALERGLDTHVSIGIGRYHGGVAGLSRSYRDARMAATLGGLVDGRGGVRAMCRICTSAFLSSLDRYIKIDLARQLLSPLDAYPELIQTIEVFFDKDCYQLEVSSALSIHRNTLSYRLAKVAEYTALDPRRFDDAVQLHLALQFRNQIVAP